MRVVDLTVSCAIISRYVQNLHEYEGAKEQVRDIALAEARRIGPLNVSVTVNAADAPERGELYLTVTGTSAESGDDGEVGRGNRTSGLITPYRTNSDGGNKKLPPPR